MATNLRRARAAFLLAQRQNARATGKKLCEMRKKRGIKQSWVADEMGIHNTRLSEMEKGKRPWFPWQISAFLVAIGEQTTKPQKGKKYNGS